MSIDERNQLRSELVGALSRCDGQRWNELVKRCHETEMDYLPDHVRETWPVLAERFDRDNPS